MKEMSVNISPHRIFTMSFGTEEEPFLFRVVQRFFTVDSQGNQNFECGLQMDLTEIELAGIIKEGTEYLNKFYAQDRYQ